MVISAQLKDLKQQLAAIVRRNSDRGFVPYSGCNRVCAEFDALSEETERQPDRFYTFDAHLLIMVETVKLISHADTSSGMVTDVIRNCHHVVDKLCQSADEDEKPYFFEAILKTVNNKAFKEWAEYAYELLRSAVYFVDDKKKADKVYAVFPVLGPMYDNKEYPAVYLITYEIMQKLEGEEASHSYMVDHIEVDELRVIAVKKAIQDKQYELAEKLCLDVLEDETYWSSSLMKWTEYLEHMYEETSNTIKLTKLARSLLLKGHSSYFSKLKVLYQSQGLWNEEMKMSLLNELSQKVLSHSYASILQEEQEFFTLLGVIESHPYLLEHYGKQVAEHYPEETGVIYEKFILNQAAEAADRRGYKGVCKLIRGYSDAVGKEKALLLIDTLSGLYPRRPAMQEELMKFKGKLVSKKRLSQTKE